MALSDLFEMAETGKERSLIKRCASAKFYWLMLDKKIAPRGAIFISFHA